MRLHCINDKIDTSSSYHYSSPYELDEYDAEQLESAGFTEAWYWYVHGGYEGSGELLGKNAAGQWKLVELGHCSCYGPTEDAGLGSWSDTLKSVLDRTVQYNGSYLTELFSAIVADGAA